MNPDTAMTIVPILRRAPVMPVLVIWRLEQAVPLAQALQRGGLPVLEITLRTPVALDAIGAIRAALPDALVGAGTVFSAADLQACTQAGAGFAVSPGLTAELAHAARAAPIPLLPGVMTPSDVMAARQAGFTQLKFFPAREAGGPAMLRTLAGPFPDVVFCPTGGITPETALDYLALDNVACVGGSWVAPVDRVEAGDWEGIAALARQAATLRRGGVKGSMA